MNIKKKCFAYLLLSDIKEGIGARIWWYIIGVPVVFYVLITVSGGIGTMFEDTSYTIADIFAYIYEGVRVFEKEEDIAFPVIYISYMLLPFIVTSYYPFNDFEGRGKVIFTRTHKRSLWWYSKCIWNIISICIYQLIMFLTAFFYCMVNGCISFMLSDGTMGRLMILPTEDINYNVLVYIFIVPTLTIISLSLLQMTISMITSPIYGMMVQVCLMVLSIFIYSPILPHNFLMVERSLLAEPKGFSLTVILPVCIVILLASVLIGRYVIEKKDIF